MEELLKITDEMREKLRLPFPKEAYSKHPTKTFLTTLKAMYVTERLNDVFGVGRWTVITQLIERTEDYVLMEGEFKSLDYDVAIPKQFGGHNTTGKNTEIADGFKSAVTDCTSKLASYLEIGIDMFKGNIQSNGDSKQKDSNPKQNQTNFETREITKIEANEIWGGKLYAGNVVYIDNKKIVIPKEQVERLKTHEKYIPNDKN